MGWNTRNTRAFLIVQGIKVIANPNDRATTHAESLRRAGRDSLARILPSESLLSSTNRNAQPRPATKSPPSGLTIVSNAPSSPVINQRLKELRKPPALNPNK